LSSRPNSSATGPASAVASSSAAAARGRCTLRLALRPRAVKPTTWTQSARASSRRSNTRTRASTSPVWCATPSTRYASYSPGAPLPPRQHLVDDQIEPDATPEMRAKRLRPADRDGETVSRVGPLPRGAHALRITQGLSRAAHSYAAAVPSLRGHEIPDRRRAVQVAQVQLHAVRVNVVGLVVEPQRRRIARPETQVRLRDIDGQVQRVVVPARVDERRELRRTHVGLLGATVLVLGVEAQGLRDVEAIERAVERRRPRHAVRRSGGRPLRIDLEDRPEWRLVLDRARELHGPPTRRGLHPPGSAVVVVPLDPRGGGDLDLPPGDLDAAHAGLGGPGPQHRHRTP